MNIQSSGDIEVRGNSIRGDGVVCANGRVWINGEEITVPKGLNTNVLVNAGGKIYVGGHEFIKSEKRFKRTLRAWFACL